MAFKGLAYLFLVLLHMAMAFGDTLSTYHHSLLTDKAALLAFRRAILVDPHSRLESWNEGNDVCNFTGVSCGRFHHRVMLINLNASDLVGLLSPFISNLTQLRVLQLADNHLFGIIPPEISFLQHLRDLRLDNNSLYGSIPASLSFLSKLVLISLRGNKFSGTIPHSVFTNCTLLYNVDFSDNLLTGNIPSEIGNCPELWTLNLYDNQLTGEIPYSLTNASDMINLDVENNHLSGELPSVIVSKLHKLWFLHLSNNAMVSHDLNTDLEPFFTALSNCSRLAELELSSMGLGGRLSSSLASVGVTLETLQLQDNEIIGSIPHDFGRFSNLMLLSGSIPRSLGNSINSLFLNNNLLSGHIPKSLGKCKGLYRVDLSFNRLTGSIPPEISEMRELRIFLNLSHNQLNGSLPIELSKLENVQEIDLSSNRLSGSIFYQISNCIALTKLNLSANNLEGHLPESLGNNLSGTIPTSLNKVHTLTFLNLSSNDLDGVIPSGGIFDSATNLSFLGNQHLCGHIPGIPACQTKGGYRVFIISASVFLSTICCLIGCRLLKRNADQKLGSSTANMLCGSIGYIAPEYGFGSSTSTKGDVYSFGVLVLEMVTRKKPTDDTFGRSLSLHEYVKSEHYRQMEIVDSSLMRALKDQSPEVMKMWEVAIRELFEVGMLCTQDSPSTRPTMLDAADDLNRLKRYLTGDTTATFASSLGISSSTLSIID
nr:putative leucine-rich repeat receptor-like serine/threonine-protein kinase At2g24130 [Ipomoea batatas]